MHQIKKRYETGPASSSKAASTETNAEKNEHDTSGRVPGRELESKQKTEPAKKGRVCFTEAGQPNIDEQPQVYLYA
jgi:hypothetical protein